MAARGDYAEIFGNRLRELRAAAGLTQRGLAALSGTSSAAISNFEAGNNAPTLGTLVRLAEALDCNVSDLVSVLDRKAPAPKRSRK
jgi:transcriptional regulator with XRE-family HTH domain